MTTPAAFKAAVVQMVSTPGVEENLAAAAKLVGEAARQGANLVVLPEYFCILGMRDTDKEAYLAQWEDRLREKEEDLKKLKYQQDKELEQKELALREVLPELLLDDAADDLPEALHVTVDLPEHRGHRSARAAGLGTRVRDFEGTDKVDVQRKCLPPG